MTTIGPLAGRKDFVVAGKTVGQITLDQYRGLRWWVTFCLALTGSKALPPAAPPFPQGAAPAGEWTITVRRNAKLQRVIAARVQRDADHELGHNGGRLSRLLDPAYDRYGALA